RRARDGRGSHRVPEGQHVPHRYRILDEARSDRAEWRFQGRIGGGRQLRQFWRHHAWLHIDGFAPLRTRGRQGEGPPPVRDGACALDPIPGARKVRHRYSVTIEEAVLCDVASAQHLSDRYESMSERGGLLAQESTSALQ